MRARKASALFNLSTSLSPCLINLTSSNNSLCVQIVVVERACMETELQLESLKRFREEFPPTPLYVVCHHGQQGALAHAGQQRLNEAADATWH